MTSQTSYTKFLTDPDMNTWQTPWRVAAVRRDHVDVTTPEPKSSGIDSGGLIGLALVFGAMFLVNGWLKDALKKDEPEPAPFIFTPFTPFVPSVTAPPVGDIDCADLRGRTFWIGAYDPNNLDADGDGWACEPYP